MAQLPTIVLTEGSPLRYSELTAGTSMSGNDLCKGAKAEFELTQQQYLQAKLSAITIVDGEKLQLDQTAAVSKEVVLKSSTYTIASKFADGKFLLVEVPAAAPVPSAPSGAGIVGGAPVLGVPAAKVRIAPSVYAKDVYGALTDKDYKCYRPEDTHGLPAALADPVFLQFVNDFSSGPLTAAELAAATEFSKVMSRVYSSEGDRRDALLPLIKKLISSEMNLRPFPSKHKSSTPDIFTGVSHGLLTSVVEVKNELQGGAEPVLEALHYRTRYYSPDPTIRKQASGNSTAPDWSTLSTTSRCPCFVAVLAGAYLSIHAVWTDTSGTSMEPLTPFLPCLIVPHRPQLLDDVARALRALRRGIEHLHTTSDHTPQTPWPWLSNVDCSDGTQLRLSYHENVKDGLVFQAQASTAGSVEPFPVLVKFSINPSPSSFVAHGRATEHNLAPRLYFHGKLCPGLHVSVSRWLPSTAGWQLLAALPDSSVCRSGLYRALRRLRAAGLVHGDLRPGNIMVRASSSKDKWHVRILDWDWAGLLASGDARYPLDRNDAQVTWPPGSVAGGEILPGHDSWMLEQLMRVGKATEAVAGKKHGRS